MMKLTSEEIQRKLLHVFFGLFIPSGMLYIPWYIRRSEGRWPVPPWAWPVIILAAFAMVFYAVEVVRFRSPWVQHIFNRLFGSMLRREESVRMTGATYIVLSALICSIIFRHRPDISFMAISTFIWGDAAAALAGISIGRIRIGKKSLEGSAACFAVCMVMYIALFPVMPFVCDAWGGSIPLALALAGSLCVTILELLSPRINARLTINDNLFVPVVTGIMILWADRIL